MGTTERIRDRGLRHAHGIRQLLAQELRDARLSAGVSQGRTASASGVSQPTISRIEHAQPGPSIESLTLLCATLGLRLIVKVYPEGSPVRDAGQLKVIERLRVEVPEVWRWATEVLVGTHGDLRAWDVRLAGPGTVGIDCETRLHDIQALQRRCEAKARDSGVDRVVLLVAETRHNARVLAEHREALRSTFPLDTKPTMKALRAGVLPPASGIVVL